MSTLPINIHIFDFGQFVTFISRNNRLRVFTMTAAINYDISSITKTHKLETNSVVVIHKV